MFHSVVFFGMVNLTTGLFANLEHPGHAVNHNAKHFSCDGWVSFLFMYI